MPPTPIALRHSLLSLIGNTPLGRVRPMHSGVSELYLKPESQTPGGSTKDHITLSMIEDGLARISVRIEAVSDLQAALEQALR